MSARPRPGKAEHARFPSSPRQHRRRDSRCNPAGRSPDRAYRARLQKEVIAVRQVATAQAQDVGSVPVRVKLRNKAAAKSHRPTGLFSDISCPIIGAGRLGELFIKGNTRGLNRLARNIEINDAKSIVKEISAVEVIEPITPQFRRKNLSSLEIIKRSPRKKNGFLLQVRLFDFGQDDQPKLVQNFQGTCNQRNLAFDQNGYGETSQVFAVECKNVEDVEAISRTIGVRSVRPMPSISTIRPQAFKPLALPTDLPTADLVEGDFPVVVVVDSGISDQMVNLATWITGARSIREQV